jgi:hypothetical protein
MSYETNKAATLALSAGEYDQAKAAFLASAEALRKGKASQAVSDAQQASTAPSDAPGDGPISTSSTSQAPAPHHANSRATVIGLNEADYRARRVEYLAGLK